MRRSPLTPWFRGPALLEYLENIDITRSEHSKPFRFPVQRVQRTDDFRGYSGQIATGKITVGDSITVLPSLRSTRVKSIVTFEGELQRAVSPQSVTITLEDELDISRGDAIVEAGNLPFTTHNFRARMIWFSEEPLDPKRRYMLKHTTQTVPAEIAVESRLDISTLATEGSTGLRINDIGDVVVETSRPIFFDPYRQNRKTGSFILIDPATHNTVAAGMIVGGEQARVASNVTWHDNAVDRDRRAATGATIWLTGLSGSGKSTVAVEIERRLVEAGRPAYLLDGDNLRHGLNADLGFGAPDRAENVRRVGEVAKLFADAGLVAVVSLVSPYRADRNRVRSAHESAGLRFIEVFVDTPIEICEARDPKGLYAKARAGQIQGFTGVDDPYEPPTSADLVLRPGHGGPSAMADLVLNQVGL